MISIALTIVVTCLLKGRRMTDLTQYIDEGSKHGNFTNSNADGKMQLYNSQLPIIPTSYRGMVAGVTSF